jgi:PKD repeat protein
LPLANSTHDADEIILTFTALDTPWANDQVVVLDGGGFYENTYLGGSNLSNTLYTYTADDGSAFINFTTDSYNLDNGDGFTLSYTSIPNPSPYCHTLINPPGNYFDFIEHVQIPTTTLDYYGFFNTAKNAAYAYYPATPPMIGQTGTLYMGTPYSINITSKSASSISCWIDYNQNNVFESNEYTSITSSNIPGVASTGTITIPSSALIGQTGMRIRTRSVGLPNGPNDACTVLSSGETEDYVITISSGIQAPNANFYSSQTNVIINGSVNFYDISTNGPTSWQWIVPGTNIFDPNLPNTGIQFYNSGCYDITLVASNAAGSDTITYTCMILVTGSTYCTGSLHLQNCDSTGFVINDFSIEGTTLNNLNSGCNGFLLQLQDIVFGR